MSGKHLAYKKLANNCIATLEILDDGVNNESRSNVVEKRYAKHRCSRALVVDIYETFNEEKKFTSGISIRNPNFIYTVGEIVESEYYDENEENECSEGIHYFLSKECAFFYTLDGVGFPLANYSGEYKRWHHNGILEYDVLYKDGKRHGERRMWHSNGKLSLVCSFIDGKEEGEELSYFENGVLSMRWNYKNGVKDGESLGFDMNGKLATEGSYKNGKMDGLWKYWDRHGHMECEQTYKDGKRDGVWTFYHTGGTMKRCVGNYKMDNLDGEWSWYNMDEKLVKKEFYKDGEFVKREVYKNGELVKREVVNFVNEN